MLLRYLAWVSIVFEITSIVSCNELEMFCPEKINFIDNLCACPYNHDNNSYFKNDAKTTVSKCPEKINPISTQVFKFIKNITKDWKTTKEVNCHDQPEEAFQQSIVLPDYTHLMSRFSEKLTNCRSEDGVVSIVVLGGSVTQGKNCYNDHTTPKEDHQFKGNLYGFKSSLPVMRGDASCPWSNRLYTLLSEQYPMCGHIDIYNLAHSGSTTEYGLNHVLDYFNQANGARHNRTISEVVDLVLLDHGVNDGTISEKPILNSLKKKTESSEYNFVQTVEAVNEYLISYILKRVRNKPALMFVDNSSPDGDTNALIPHYDAAKRFGVPMSSVRHAASYPDNPCWISFNSPPDTLYEKRALNPFTGLPSKLVRWSNNGYYYDYGVDQVPHLEFNGAWTRSPVKEGPLLFRLNSASKESDKARTHNFIKCWGKSTHPGYPVHGLIAEVVFYSIHLMAESTRLTVPHCQEGKSSDSSLVKSNNDWKQASKFAQAQSPKLNHMAFCGSYGPLSEYNSEELYLKHINSEGAKEAIDLNMFGDNAHSDWKLIQDRPHKYGFIIEKSPSDPSDDKRSILRFNIKINLKPRISIEYLHSYENAGKVQVSIEPSSRKSNRSSKSNVVIEDPSKLVPGTSIIIDSYNPSSHYALYTEIALSGKGFPKGDAVLEIKLLQQSSSPGGNRFKLVGVKTC